MTWSTNLLVLIFFYYLTCFFASPLFHSLGRTLLLAFSDYFNIDFVSDNCEPLPLLLSAISPRRSVWSFDIALSSPIVPHFRGFFDFVLGKGPFELPSYSVVNPIAYSKILSTNHAVRFPYFDWLAQQDCLVYNDVDFTVAWLVFTWFFVVLCCIWLLSRPFVRDYLLTLLIWCCSSPISPDRRSEFRASTAVSLPNKPSRVKPHPEAAHSRYTANALLDAFLSRIRAKRYDVSTSASTAGAGSRFWYFAKDLRFSPSLREPKSSDVYTMVDVDYYLHLPSYCDGHDLLLNTFYPHKVADRSMNGHYWFNADNTVTYEVDGGAVYNHAIWNLDVDDLTVDHWWGSASYLVEHCQINADRRVVYFNHIRNVYGPLGWFLPGARLVRRSVVVDGVARIRDNDDIHLARAGSRSQITLPESVIDATLVRLKSSISPHISDAERIFSAAKIPDAANTAAVFYDVYSFYSAPFARNVNPRPFSYSPIGPIATEDGKQTMRPVGTAMLSGFSPVRGYNSEHSTVSKRILEVANNNPCPSDCSGYKEEFIGMIVHVLGCSAVPDDFETYRLSLDNNTAIARDMDRNETLSVAKAMATVSSFQKSEAAAKLAPPRNISKHATSHNFRLGQFVAAAGRLFKKLPWYGPGKTPAQVGERVVGMLSTSLFLLSTDFTRLDGSNSEFCASVYQDLLCAIFFAKYSSIIVERLQAEGRSRGFTSTGQSYLNEFRVTSGSTDTSQMVTIINAYLSYCSYRQASLEPGAAFNALGFYFGDDGASPDLSAHISEGVCGRHGYHVKSSISTRGEPITLLGRVYLDPFVSGECIADVVRQFRKLHLTDCPVVVPNWLVCYRRAMSYLVTDPTTPVLSDWSHAVVRVVTRNFSQQLPAHILKLADKEKSYWTRFSDRFRTPSAEAALPYVAINLGVDVARIAAINVELSKADTLEKCFFILRDDVAEVKVDVQSALGGAVLPADASKPHKDKVAANASKSSAICFAFLKGNCTHPNCKFRHINGKEAEAARRDRSKSVGARFSGSSRPIAKNFRDRGRS